MSSWEVYIGAFVRAPIEMIIAVVERRGCKKCKREHAAAFCSWCGSSAETWTDPGAQRKVTGNTIFTLTNDELRVYEISGQYVFRSNYSDPEIGRVLEQVEQIAVLPPRAVQEAACTMLRLKHTHLFALLAREFEQPLAPEFGVLYTC